MPPDRSGEPPFLAEVGNAPVAEGRFEPRCRVVIGASVPELARAVGLDALGLLAVVAALTTPNGRTAPSAPLLSGALGLPLPLLRPRLRRLARARWRGEPAVLLLPSAAGADAVRPGPKVMGRREAPPAEAAAPEGAARPVPPPVPATLPPTRPGVEMEIVASQGWQSPGELEEGRSLLPREPDGLDGRWAVQRLVREGVDYVLAVRLVERYGAEACLDQCRWLPRRKGVKQKARYLVAAIMRGYAEPPSADLSDLTS